ncbi:hypothetical protein ACEWY4_021108 [Coilia grayii]|uniref:Uncharacterized protein n=1 Tax=Coilia grayii TaxID=363190 RepID=A0ABD1J9S4_9TELE
MVIIYSKTLEVSKGVDNHVPSTMSKGTTLFSCSSVEGDRWPALAGGCVQPESAHQGGGLWEALPAPHQPPARTAASALTNLIQDLSLNEAHGSHATAPATHTLHTHASTHTHNHTHAAPPTKRQCRSLSSDELMWGGGAGGGGGGGASFSLSSSSSPWRPQGSRVWSWVEKRRWHSGPPMQRSCSVSLPSRPHTHPHGHAHGHGHPHGRAHTLPLDLQPPLLLLGTLEPSRVPGSGGSGGPGGGAGAGAGAGGGGGAGPGPGSLPRSRSQPCVLSERKVAGVKRRRPDEHSSQEARPSLDLAKMTQKQHFHSLSCPGFSFFETCHSPVDPPTSTIPSQSETTHTCPSGLGAGSRQGSRKRDGDGEEDSSYEEEEEEEGEELDSDSACSVGSRCDTPNRGEEEEDDEEEEEHGMFWKGVHRVEEKEAACELDGELDIEQIERN